MPGSWCSGSSHLFRHLELPQLTFEKSNTVNKRLHYFNTKKDLSEIRDLEEINEMSTTSLEFLLRTSGESRCNRLSRLLRYIPCAVDHKTLVSHNPLAPPTGRTSDIHITTPTGAHPATPWISGEPPTSVAAFYFPVGALAIWGW